MRKFLGSKMRNFDELRKKRLQAGSHTFIPLLFNRDCSLHCTRIRRPDSSSTRRFWSSSSYLWRRTMTYVKIIDTIYGHTSILLMRYRCHIHHDRYSLHLSVRVLATIRSPYSSTSGSCRTSTNSSNLSRPKSSADRCCLRKKKLWRKVDLASSSVGYCEAGKDSSNSRYGLQQAHFLY